MNLKDVKTYADFVKYENECHHGMVLNNEIIKHVPIEDIKFQQGDWYYTDEDGEEMPSEWYQYYIVDELFAIDLYKYTYEDLMYIESLDMFIWCIGHYGTDWSYVNIDMK